MATRRQVLWTFWGSIVPLPATRKLKVGPTSLARSTPAEARCARKVSGRSGRRCASGRMAGGATARPAPPAWSRAGSDRGRAPLAPHARRRPSPLAVYTSKFSIPVERCRLKMGMATLLFALRLLCLGVGGVALLIGVFVGHNRRGKVSGVVLDFSVEADLVRRGGAKPARAPCPWDAGSPCRYRMGVRKGAPVTALRMGGAHALAVLVGYRLLLCGGFRLQGVARRSSSGSRRCSRAEGRLAMRGCTRSSSSSAGSSRWRSSLPRCGQLCCRGPGACLVSC